MTTGKGARPPRDFACHFSRQELDSLHALLHKPEVYHLVMEEVGSREDHPLTRAVCEVNGTLEFAKQFPMRG